MEENKVLSKKEQIEIIIDRIRKFNKIQTKLSNVLNENLEIFNSIYDIGYEIIPAILGTNIEEFNFNLNINLDNDILFLVLNNYITKEEFYNKIEKYI